MISEKLSTDSRRMLQNGVPQFVGFCRCTPCRQRRGKVILTNIDGLTSQMHPVQAAPRQSIGYHRGVAVGEDAPRAGSAEAKIAPWRICARNGAMHPVQAAPRQSSFLPAYCRAGAGCTPCRQRRGKGPSCQAETGSLGCTPCRQRRGKVRSNQDYTGNEGMHPVQAAPRQSKTPCSIACWSRDAPRAGSAEAKSC